MKNIQQCTHHASSFFYFSASPLPDVRSLPLQKITTYMSTFLEVDNWTEAHYQALKPCMELYFLLLILLLLPTLIFVLKKYEHCKIEKRCQPKRCLHQQEFMRHEILFFSLAKFSRRGQVIFLISGHMSTFHPKIRRRKLTFSKNKSGPVLPWVVFQVRGFKQPRIT